MTADKRTQSSKPAVIPRLLRWAGMSCAVFAVVLALTLLNNNYSFSRQSRAKFNAQLDGALDRAIDWIVACPELFEQNPSLMYMISDMERMSGDPRLRSLLQDYGKSDRIVRPSTQVDYIWRRLVDRNAHLPFVSVYDLRTQGFEVVWDAYGVAPHNVAITDELKADMFSPTKFYWGRRQHQLLALVIYRDFNGSSDELDATMNHLSEKVARDAHYDFRVTDSYVQRTAFVLAATRPDLIRRRWVERILDYQNADGSWNYCWYGWCRGIFEFGPISSVHTTGQAAHATIQAAHATIQAAWVLTMLRYRYPQWIEERYISR